MPIEEKRIKISSRLSEVANAVGFVREVAEAAGLDAEGIHHCQLAVDEACTNIIEHGYGVDQTQNRHIEIVVVGKTDRLFIHLFDESPPFNPLEQPDPNPMMQLEERKGGGWGVYFIRKVIDEIYYTYDEGQNHLTFVKYLFAATPNETAPLIHVTSVQANIGLVAPQHRLDALATQALEKVIHAQLMAGVKYLILDLHQAESISVDALKMLISQRNRARDVRGDLILAALTPSVRELIHLTGFDLVLTVTDSVDAALTHLKNSK